MTNKFIPYSELKSRVSIMDVAAELGYKLDIKQGRKFPVMVKTDGSVLFSIDVIPNFELERDVLGFGEGITIISPKHLAEKLQQRLRDSLQQYENAEE